MTGRLNFLEKPWGGIEPFDETLPALLRTKNVFTHMVTDHYLYLHVGGENYWNDFTSNEIIRGQEFDSIHMPACAEGIPTQVCLKGTRESIRRSMTKHTVALPTRMNIQVR